jgi:hypothetical protein
MENRISFSTLNRGLYNYNKENVENRNDFVFAKKKKKKEREKKKDSVMISRLHVTVFYMLLLFVSLVKQVAPFHFFILALYNQ